MQRLGLISDVLVGYTNSISGYFPSGSKPIPRVLIHFLNTPSDILGSETWELVVLLSPYTEFDATGKAVVATFRPIGNVIDPPPATLADQMKPCRARAIGVSIDHPQAHDRLAACNPGPTGCEGLYGAILHARHRIGVECRLIQRFGIGTQRFGQADKAAGQKRFLRPAEPAATS